MQVDRFASQRSDLAQCALGDEGRSSFLMQGFVWSLGSVGYENATNEGGNRLIWLAPNVVNRLRAMRRPGESYSDGEGEGRLMTHATAGGARRSATLNDAAGGAAARMQMRPRRKRCGTYSWW
jgi:hypothetical protein